jgi:hypothetical protein
MRCVLCFKDIETEPVVQLARVVLAHEDCARPATTALRPQGLCRPVSPPAAAEARR